ncbi:MAG: short-chain type dehydrogenase/reductase [Candidatus Hydrogenedentota bacterium]
MNEFKDRVAVVTGAASGIGFALSSRFAREGMRIVMSDVEEAALHEAAGRVCDTGAQVVAVRADVSKAADVENLANQTYEAFGAVHVLCNNAGVAVSGLIRENSLRDWEWVIGVNLWGVIHGLRSFLPRMIEQDTDGHIVNTASIAGIITGPGMGVYCASKHAVVGLSESLYHELTLMGSKVSVSVLCPAWVKTRISDSDRNRPEPLSDRRETSHPLAGLLENWARTAVSNGISADHVADEVLGAIRDKRFYILTHSDMTELIRRRMEGIVDGINPQTAPVPGLTVCRTWHRTNV